MFRKDEDKVHDAYALLVFRERIEGARLVEPLHRLLHLLTGDDLGPLLVEVG